MNTSLKTKTVRGIFWSSIERFSVQFVQFIISVIIARILSPEDYGIIGMLSIFLAVAQTFVDSGFSNALIRKLDRTEVDNSTVFYFNIIIGVVFYTILFFSAPAIAVFYNTPILVPVTRLLSLGIIFNSLTIVQNAILTARVDFKTQAKSSLISTIISGSIGVSMAYLGYGIWSLVFQAIIGGLSNVILLWVLVKWKPLFVFSWESFFSMFGFGSKLLISALIDTLYKNIYTLVIGKVYNSEDLGYYTKANNFAQLPSSNINGIIQRVTYPILCEYQNDNIILEVLYRKYLRLAAFIVFPLMIGLSAISRPLISVILSEKWDGAALLLQILCISMMWYPIHAINLNLLQVKGRSDLFLRLEVVKKIIGVSILVVTIPMGIEWMCFGGVLSSILCLAVNTHYTGKLIDLGFFKQMRELVPALFYSISMAIVIYLFINSIYENILKLIGGIIVGAVYYVGISKLTQSSELKDLLSLIRK